MRRLLYGFIIILLSLPACSAQPATVTPPSGAVVTEAATTAQAAVNQPPQFTKTPTRTPTATGTATATKTPSPSPTPTATPSPTSTATLRPRATATSANTVTPTSQPGDRPTPTSPPTQTQATPEPAEVNKVDEIGLVTGDLVNVRQGPGTSFEIVGQVALSQTVQIVGQTEAGDWWQICCLDDTESTAWVTADWVEIVSITGSAQRLPEEISLPESAQPETEDQPESPSITVTGDQVNLRAGPGTEFAAAGRVVLSQTLRLVGRNADQSWWQVCCPAGDDTPVWITAEFVTTNLPPDQIAEQIALVEAPTGEKRVAAVSTNTETTFRKQRIPETDTVDSPAVEKAASTSAPKPASEADLEPASELASESAPPPGPILNPLANLPPPGSFVPYSETNPLTGLPLPPGKRDQRPIIVCINNDPQARPQFGLNQADVMYEYFMEGFYITRFSAIYFGQTTETIGPVRSARLVNFYLASLYDSPLVCSGASDRVRYILKTGAPFPYLDIDLDDRSNSLYTESVGNDYRTRVRTSTDSLRQWLQDWDEERSANIRGFTFGPAPFGGVPAQAIEIPYTKATRSYVAYEYNPVSGRYVRSLGGEPHLDGNTGAQIGLDNVVVQYTFHETTDIIEDSLGSRGLHINLFGQGRAIVFRDGQGFEGTWQSSSRGDLPRFYDQAGNEIPLKPGNTWISVLADSYEVTWE